MKKLFTFLTSAMIILSLAQCKKGEMGPAGPQGQQGVAGTNGAKGDRGEAGATGPRGETGTANVIYSDYLTSVTGIRDSTIDGSKVKVTHLNVPSITNDIMKNGVVLVYFNFGGGVFSLPHTSNAGAKTSTIDYHLKLGRIIISRFTHDNTASISLSNAIQYRYIIIPGGVRAQLKDIDLSDYDRVKQTLSMTNH